MRVLGVLSSARGCSGRLDGGSIHVEFVCGGLVQDRFALGARGRFGDGVLIDLADLLGVADLVDAALLHARVERVDAFGEGLEQLEGLLDGGAFGARVADEEVRDPALILDRDAEHLVARLDLERVEPALRPELRGRPERADAVTDDVLEHGVLDRERKSGELCSQLGALVPPAERGAEVELASLDRTKEWHSEPLVGVVKELHQLRGRIHESLLFVYVWYQQLATSHHNKLPEPARSDRRRMSGAR